MANSTSSSFTRWLVLIGLTVVIVGLGGLVGAVTGTGDSLWYQALEKPFFNPPGYVFGIVWPILYTLMAIATWLIWQAPATPQRQRALTLFGVQLAFNYAWPFMFSVFEMIGVAAVWILALVVILFMTVRAYAKIIPITGWMLAPYLAWSTFAFVLNASIFYLNA
ncbi:MAG: TspO/MBR family protein [Pseudomonadota bacterium]